MSDSDNVASWEGEQSAGDAEATESTARIADSSRSEPVSGVHRPLHAHWRPSSVTGIPRVEWSHDGV